MPHIRPNTALRMFAIVVYLSAVACLSGCASSSKIAFTGHVLATDEVIRLGPIGTPCHLYVDGIDDGDAVTITDENGHSLATSTLGAGVVAHDSSTCQFNFTGHVTRGESKYLIHVGSGSPKSFSAEQMANGPTLRFVSN